MAPTNTAALAKPATGRFDELEGYRGIAALLIVVFHAYQYAREALKLHTYLYEGTPLHLLLHSLDASVSWFFVLSGFLVFLPFARSAIAQQARQSSRGFLIRRAIRIVPTYYLAILVIWTLRFTGGADQWRDLIEHLTFTQIFDQEHFFWTIGPAWTLAIEVWFYLLLALAGPLLHQICGRFATPRARSIVLAGIAALLACGSVGYKYWAWYLAGIPRDTWPVYFGLLAQFDGLAFGMLLAVVVSARGAAPLLRGAAPTLVRVAGLMLMVAAALLRSPDSPADVFFFTLGSAAFALVLASTVLGQREARWARALARAPLPCLGLISYSVYLWHEPIMIELGARNLLISSAPAAFPINALVLSALSLIAAAASYYALERPTMQLRFLFERDGKLARRYPEERAS
jgi:peptidoglycan/LPS O-acetylase OafA/YrhL